MHLRQLIGRQRRGVLPGLAPHGVMARATGELALGAIHLAVQIIALDVADGLTIQIDLVQMATSVVQVIDLAHRTKSVR